MQSETTDVPCTTCTCTVTDDKHDKYLQIPSLLCTLPAMLTSWPTENSTSIATPRITMYCQATVWVHGDKWLSCIIWSICDNNSHQTDAVVDGSESAVWCTTAELSVASSTCDASISRLNAESWFSSRTDGLSYSTTCNITHTHNTAMHNSQQCHAVHTVLFSTKQFVTIITIK